MYTEPYVATIMVRDRMSRAQAWARREDLIAQLEPRASAWRTFGRAIAEIWTGGGRPRRRAVRPADATA